MTPIRILLLEDNPLDAELTLDTLQQAGFEVEAVRAADRDSFCSGLDPCPELILADYSLPGFDGLTALDLASRQCPDTPFIFVTGALGEERAIEVLTRGATDYVLKHRLERLGPAVDRALRETRERAERRRLEEALRSSEAAYRTLTEAIPAIVWVASPDGSVQFYNQRWYEYTGLSPEEGFGWAWEATLHPEDRKEVAASWKAAVEAGHHYQTECRIRDRAGAYRWFLVRGISLTDADQRLIRWFGTCIDIDDQKRALQELALADERKNEFLAMLAHELRNPLAPILNAVHLMHASPELPPGVERARAVIDRQSRHMARLLEDLLDVSRITRGKILIRRQAVDLSLLIREVAEDHRITLERSSLRLETRIPPEPIIAECDPTRISQVVGNLLHNAGKFTPAGGLVSLAVEPDLDAGTVQVVVRDTGTGITPEILPQIFEPFRQDARSLCPTHGGLGLGLALVRGLVELHSGSVAARSDGAGRGAEFTVSLPLSPSAVAAAHQARSRSTPPLARLRILVVDDNRDAADTLCDILEGQEHEVRVAYSGESGLEAARHFAPEVVLCDLGLPGLNGFQVAQALREDPGTRTACLVAVTGYGRDEDRRRAEEAGFNWHLVKPVDPATLEELLGGPSVRVAP